MSKQDVPQSFYNPEAAVFRPEEFYGREGLVRNLLWRLERRESLSIIGGPKLGKTSLLLHLAWQLNHSSSASRSNSPQAVYVDMSIEKDRRQFIETRANGELVMLLDNCDYVLADDHNVFALSSMVERGVIVYAGGRDWMDFVKSGGFSGFKRQPRPIPLSVFLEKEAHQVLGEGLSSEHRITILEQAGTHPYVLKAFGSLLLAEGKQCKREETIQRAGVYLFPFFQRCIKEMKEPMEHDVLAHVINVRVPINPREVARFLKLPTIKPLANTLCILGLIRRWIQNEEATLCAGCRLFNEWYMESKTSGST